MNQAAKNRIKRFTPLQRIFHVLLMISFLTQGVTGLARMYIETAWGRWLAWLVGGYESALLVHKVVGILMLCGFGLHGLYLILTVNWRRFPQSLFGPDSLLPRLTDVKQFFQHVGWFLGIAQPPRFDRWGYWEKFDYWAVFWGMVIMGGTGLILAYSLIATRFMPGWVLNVVIWIHRIEAILAMAHVFIIHFFVVHFRSHNFPMDMAMFEGSVALGAVRYEKPAWIERMEKSGELDHVRVAGSGLGRLTFFYLFGYAAVATGVFLLIGGLVNSPFITW
ncbi:MAG: cytochrome b/b6 domain-containing protein [Thermodesulfobacteriota bacterium]